MMPFGFPLWVASTLSCFDRVVAAKTKIEVVSAIASSGQDEKTTSLLANELEHGRMTAYEVCHYDPNPVTIVKVDTI